MRVGRVVGKTILALLDALAAGIVAGIGAFWVMPIMFVSTRTQLAILATGVVGGITLAISAALVGLGKRPFPATRLAKAAVDRIPWWA